MTKINLAAIFGVPAIALIFATNAHAQANVTMSYSDVNTYAENSGSFDATINNVTAISSVDLIGIYRFTVQHNTADVPASIWATCVSPAGLLTAGPYQYNLVTFAGAGTGINPSAWATGSGGQQYGIQNANFLFNQLSGNIINGSSGQLGSKADQGAALALAMYDALYNSTAFGTKNDTSEQVLGGSAFQFNNGGPTGDVLKDYNADLTLLTGANVDPVTGSLLLPVNEAIGGPSGQEQLFLLAGSQAVQAVPEASTVFAGALMLLPLGASMIRVVRRNRVA